MHHTSDGDEVSFKEDLVEKLPASLTGDERVEIEDAEAVALLFRSRMVGTINYGHLEGFS